MYANVSDNVSRVAAVILKQLIERLLNEGQKGRRSLRIRGKGRVWSNFLSVCV